jgi:hypothetical protein
MPGNCYKDTFSEKGVTMIPARMKDLFIICMVLMLSVTVAGHQVNTPYADQDDWRDPRLRNIHADVPPTEGEYYQRQIPDTLELTGMAALAINAVTRMLNPEYDYTQYSYADLRHDPPWMMMEAGITNLNPKFIEALPLMRIMSGSKQNADVDHHLVESMLHNIGKDGLTYQPPDHPGAFYEDFSREQNLPASNIFGEGRQLIALSIMAQLSADPAYRRAAERKIQRLLEIASPKGDGLYFRRTQGYTPEQKNTDTLDVVAVTDHEVKDSSFGMVGTAVAHSVSLVAMGAARYYLATGYEPALELARGMANYYKNDAGLIEDSGRWHGYHFHIMAMGILGQLEYAAAANDSDMLQWARRAYEYGKSIGEPTLGFYAGIPGCEACTFNLNAEECGQSSESINVEPCGVSDMAIIALKLSRANVGDYYEDVEHYVRNFLVEMQVTDTEFLKDYPKEISRGGQMRGQFTASLGKTADLRRVSYNNVAERSVGSFCAADPNQWFQGMPGPFVIGCCLGNAGRALYYAWDSILENNGDDLRVHLLMNRASRWADMDSYLPYEGKVVLSMKEKKDVQVRIPGWTLKDQVDCTVNGRKRDFTWLGNYISVEGLKPGDELVVQFPMIEKKLYRGIMGQDYWYTVRGFSVVDLEPHADITPIFRREYLRTSPAPVRTVERFVSGQEITW